MGERQPARFPLTRGQRAELFAGRCPALHGPRDVAYRRKDGTSATKTILKRCPVKAGDIIQLSSLLHIRVLRVDTQKGGLAWRLHYELVDRRDPVRKLRRTPPVVVPEADDLVPDENAVKRAAQESSYASDPWSTISDAGEAPPEKVTDRYSRESQQDRAKRVADYERQLRAKPLHEQLHEALEEARRTGVDTARYEESIEKRVEALRRRTRRQAA